VNRLGALQGLTYTINKLSEKSAKNDHEFIELVKRIQIIKLHRQKNLRLIPGMTPHMLYRQKKEKGKIAECWE
jgi:hypothetical protein